jgi:hypothetical protein
LPAAAGAAINETRPTAATAAWKLTCAVFSRKETLVLQDGRRLAPVGFAGDTVDLNTDSSWVD